ncbi:uncharacterized protein LOC142803872 isoform X1 [Rhipicephalus microplus]|uniref:uncharacterized protein LOC142803872 isoform X1 n=1 Tax=Rhipicephalus microplus TaxID=6941 RepID=UPI003F6B6D0C
MTETRNRNILKHIAIFSLLSTLNCGSPAHSFDTIPTEHHENPRHQQLSSSHNSPRPPGPLLHVPLLHSQYHPMFARPPPLVVGLLGPPPASLYNPMQGFLVSPETRHFHRATQVSQVPSAPLPGQSFGNRAPLIRDGEGGRKRDALRRRWSRMHDSYFHNVLTYGEPAIRESSSTVRRRPPRFSQARHPRARNTQLPELPAASLETQLFDADR